MRDWRLPGAPAPDIQNFNMHTFAATPISRDELNELSRLLDGLPSDGAMNLATVDGFFAALVAGPQEVPPSEYLPLIGGGEGDDGLTSLGDIEDARRLVHLLRRLWDSIRIALDAGLDENTVYLPNFDTDARGRVCGNEWANGFLRGLRMRSEGWSVLLQDQREVHLMVPMFTLAHEHNPVAELRSGPITDAQRTDLIRRATAYLTLIYRYFAPFRARSGSAQASVHDDAKVKRNDPCPCGSGRKFKHCCGDPARLH